MEPSATDPSSPTLIRLLGIPGNESAWRIFVDRYSPMIVDHCRRARLQPADIEEIRSRVLAKLVRLWSACEPSPKKTFRGYVRMVVQNTIIDYWAERSRPGATGTGSTPELDLEQVAVPAPLESLGDDLEARLLERLGLIERVVEHVRNSVSAEVWQAYWLTAVEEKPAPEVAEFLGKSIGSVHMAKHRVGAMLRETGKRFVSA